MNFFQQLESIAGAFDFQITFKKKGDKITVGVFPSNSNKEISEKIKAITMIGTAAELDEGFFQNLNPAMQKISGLITNIETVDAELKKLEEQKKGKAAGTKAKEEEDKKPAAKKAEQKKEQKPDDEVKEPVEVQKSIFE